MPYYDIILNARCNVVVEALSEKEAIEEAKKVNSSFYNISAIPHLLEPKEIENAKKHSDLVIPYVEEW